MPFLPVVLPTDLLLWLLIAAVAFYGRYCSRRPHLGAPWGRVFRSKAAVMSVVVLAAYLVIGVADSIHFRARLPGGNAYSPEVLSLLDVAFKGLKERRERTYSEPLATRLYAKEMLEVEGKQLREFPRL